MLNREAVRLSEKQAKKKGDGSSWFFCFAGSSSRARDIEVKMASHGTQSKGKQRQTQKKRLKPFYVLFYKNILRNKRIWKHFILFATIYGSSFRYFDRWYSNSKTSSSVPLSAREAEVRKAIEVDEIKDYDPIGHSGHRRAELVLEIFASFFLTFKGRKFLPHDEKAFSQSLTVQNTKEENKVRPPRFLALSTTKTRAPFSPRIVLYGKKGSPFPTSTRLCNAPL